MAGKRDQQMKEITERLEQGVKELFTSEMYTEYLKTMSQFHNYSFNNTLLIAMQKPDATLVAGYQAWQKKFKRQVKKGEKGIQIIAPAQIREKEEVEKFDPVTNEPVLRPDGQPETEEVVHTIPRFRVTTVFDVSQTYGEPLPELETPELMGKVENFEIFMQAIREVSPVPVRFDEIESGAKGFYSNVNKEIVIQDGMSESQTMKTAVHETTHAKLHDRDIMEELGEKKNQMTREVEAESVAYTVCQYFGLDTSDYSFPYIAGWSSSMEMKELRSSMDTIRKTAGEFIDSMTEVLQRLMREQQEKEHLEEREELRGQTEKYQQVEFYDVPALFSNGRVERDALPEGIFCYDLRGADYDPGHPLIVENHVVMNHAATILTVVPVTMLEQGYLRLGDGLNFTGGEQTIPEYQQEMAVRNMEADKGIVESAIGRNNENLYLSGTEECYAIYQIAGNSKGREYQFMGLDFVTSHDMSVDAADYVFVYGGRLSAEETLDSLYEKFNLNHPAGYQGHSLSVSDVVVMQREGQAKAYYVDSFGFTELPDFVRQRLHETEMNRKREDSAVTLDTSGIEIDQHEGLWHTVDKREIGDEIFYLMKHNEYGDSVAAVIVDADGELVAQELENGFDRGAMEAIHEYLAGKGIAWEPEAEKAAEIPEQKQYLPVYRNTLAYAAEHGAADEYLDSRKLNIDCKKAVEGAIRSHFDGMHLAHDVVDGVLEEYGSERLSFVLACTVQYKESDGRFSRDTKEWAKSIPVPENMGRGTDLNHDYVVESHPAVLDGFIGIAREKFAELDAAKAIPLISDMKEPEKSLNGQSRAEMEQANTCLDEKEMQILATELDRFASEIDPYEYQDNMGDDPGEGYRSILESIVNGETEGMKEQLALIAEENEIPENVAEAKRLLSRLKYMETLQQGAEPLKETADIVPESTISFYVAECMEFPVLGEYHDNLSLQEAAELYEKIPADRINGIKGIGFRLEDGSIYDGDYELMSGGKILQDSIDLVEHYRESPLVQKAIADLKKILSEKKERDTVMETEKQQIEQPEKQSAAKDMTGIEGARETDLKPEKTPEKAPETHSSVSEGTGRKQSVLKALRERQAKLKTQEQKETEQKPQKRKKGEQEL